MCSLESQAKIISINITPVASDLSPKQKVSKESPEVPAVITRHPSVARIADQHLVSNVKSLRQGHEHEEDDGKKGTKPVNTPHHDGNGVAMNVIPPPRASARIVPHTSPRSASGIQQCTFCSGLSFKPLRNFLFLSTRQDTIMQKIPCGDREETCLTFTELNKKSCPGVFCKACTRQKSFSAPLKRLFNTPLWNKSGALLTFLFV